MRSASWWIVAAITIGLLLVGVRVFLTPMLVPGSGDARYLSRLTEPKGLECVAGAVLLFGWAMTHVTVEMQSPESPGARHGPRSFAVFAVAIILEIASTVANFSADRSPPRVYPENAVEARRVIVEAERDARANPDDGHAQFAYGLSLLNLGRYAEAKPVLVRAEELLPDEAWPANALGWLLLRQRDYAGALPHFQHAVKLDPDYGEAYQSLGWTLFSLGRFAEAEAAYSRAAKLEPRESGLAADYAWLLYRENKTDRALVEADRAIRLDSSVARYHATAGYLLRSKARFPDARAEFERAVVLDPSIAGAWVQLGITDFLMGDSRGADTAFATAVQRDSMAIAAGSPTDAMWKSARKGKGRHVHVDSKVELRVEPTTTVH